jgi:hypothetical protein
MQTTGKTHWSAPRAVLINKLGLNALRHNTGIVVSCPFFDNNKAGAEPNRALQIT